MENVRLSAVKYSEGTQYADLSWATEQLVQVDVVKFAYEVWYPKSGL